MTPRHQDAGAVASTADDEQLTSGRPAGPDAGLPDPAGADRDRRVFSALAPNRFANIGNARLIAQNASILAILGVGMTFVIITSGIDLSIGSVMVFSGVIAAKVMIWWCRRRRTAGARPIGIAASVLTGLAWGLLNGFLIAKAKIPPLIVTLARSAWRWAWPRSSPRAWTSARCPR